MAKRYQARIFWILSDGKWHDAEEMVELLRDLVRPEDAIRRSYQVPSDLDSKIIQGCRKILHDSLWRMSGSKRIGRNWGVEVIMETHPKTGKPVVARARLSPNSWSKATNSKQRLGRLLEDLKVLLTQGKIALTGKVSSHRVILLDLPVKEEPVQSVG